MAKWPEELIARKNIPAAIKAMGYSSGQLHEQTIRRWYTRGVRGATLEVVLLGGRVFTTRSRINKFYDDLNDPSECSEVEDNKAIDQPFNKKRARRIGNRLLRKIAMRRASK
jgi:hypothetical protein